MHAFTFLGTGGKVERFQHSDVLLGMISEAHQRFEGHPDPMTQLRRTRDSAFYLNMAEKRGIRRGDAFADVGGLHLPRDLEYLHAQVLEEKRPVPNAMKLFPTSQTIPPGARTHTVRRMMEDGEARWYRGGKDVPSVGISQKEEQFPVKHIVTSIRTNHFELLSSNFAGLNEQGRKLRTARRIMESFLNDKLWNGDDDQNYKGVLNYPFLAKKVSAVAFDGTATAADVLAEMNAAANYPTENSFSVFAPNRCATSPRVRNFLMNTQHSLASDTTIGEFFTRVNAHISVIEEAWELKDAGGTGVDGILFWADDPDAIAHEAAQGLTILPAQSFGFDNITYMYMSTGGIVMRDAGNNILLLVTA